MEKFLGYFEAMLALAFQTRDNWFLSSRVKPHPNSRDRKSQCSFIDSSECWLGFYRHFLHYKNSHYKNCKIKGKLQICCWVFISELIKTQSKQKLQWKSSSTSGKIKTCIDYFVCDFVSPTDLRPWTCPPWAKLHSHIHQVSILWFQWMNPETILTTYLAFYYYLKKTMMYGCWFLEGLRKLWQKNFFYLGKAHRNPYLISWETCSHMVCFKNSDKSICNNMDGTKDVMLSKNKSGIER